MITVGNINNLIQFSGRQSPEEARKNGQKCGIASGAVRRQRKELRQLTADLMLSEAVPQYRAIIKQAFLYVTQLEALLDSASRYLEINDSDRAAALVAVAEDVVAELRSEVFAENKKAAGT